MTAPVLARHTEAATQFENAPHVGMGFRSAKKDRAARIKDLAALLAQTEAEREDG